MRIWSLHPGLLDRQALVACWRESLLAQKVLAGETRGYRSHPQLERFRARQQPLAAISAYLAGVAAEAERRGYSFNRSLIRVPPEEGLPSLTVTDGQLAFELEHLRQKSRLRSPGWFAEQLETAAPLPHPIFRVVGGAVEPFERI